MGLKGTHGKFVHASLCFARACVHFAIKLANGFCQHHSPNNRAEIRFETNITYTHDGIRMLARPPVWTIFQDTYKFNTPTNGSQQQYKTIHLRKKANHSCLSIAVIKFIRRVARRECSSALFLGSRNGEGEVRKGADRRGAHQISMLSSCAHTHRRNCICNVCEYLNHRI